MKSAHAQDIQHVGNYLYELKSLTLKETSQPGIPKVISENPVLLRRPVVLAKHKGVIGDPVENIKNVLWIPNILNYEEAKPV